MTMLLVTRPVGVICLLEPIAEVVDAGFEGGTRGAIVGELVQHARDRAVAEAINRRDRDTPVPGGRKERLPRDVPDILEGLGEGLIGIC